MSRTGLNQVLFVVFIGLVLAAWFLRRDVSQPNYVFTPEMVFSVPYDSFAENPIFRDGKTMQLPVEGTVARGETLFEYEATEADAKRAGNELVSPWSMGGIEEDDLFEAKNRGRQIYSTFCLPCHGAVGNADGPVAKRGFLGVTPLSSETSLNMSDGQMFHVVTYGQRFIKDKRMPGYASQVSAEDRWKVILHVRGLQQATIRKIEAEKKLKASIEVGAQVFQRLDCHKCHTVSPDERPVGPILSKVSQTYTREQLLEAIEHPSRAIAEGYVTQKFLMMNGKKHSGFVTAETEKEITIRNSDGDQLILQVDNIDERDTVEKSPMPVDLIKDLPEGDLDSLLDYLQSLAKQATAETQTKEDVNNNAAPTGDNQ